MRVGFRVDASRWIGTGHLARCLTLAEALQERGAECFFIHRRHEGHLASLIRGAGFAVCELAAPEGNNVTSNEADYTAWLGLNPDQDARETAEALGEKDVDWLVVDHYALGADWEAALRPRVEGIAVLDDLANRPHDCDLLIDQNRMPDAEGRYEDLIPEHARCLCGPRYALLRPEYARARELIGPRRGPLSRVLLFYGGADVHNETGRALRVLNRPAFRHFAVDVVVGANHPQREAIQEQAQQRPGIQVHGPRDHLVDLMIEADLALGAGGTTTWERCALGLPGLVTAVAENQLAFNYTLAEDGAVRFLGHWSEVSDDDLAHALGEYNEDPGRLAEMGGRAWRITDGLGRLRVAEALAPNEREALSLRSAGRSDKALYFEWANDPGTRAQANNPEPIPWAAPDQWFERRLADPETFLWVMVTPQGLPVGQVRVELESQEAILSYSLDPAFRGRGWGTRLLGLAAAAWQSEAVDHPLGEEAHGENAASSRAFLRAGIEETTAPEGRAEVLSLTVLSDSGSWINDWVPGLLAGWLREGHSVRWVNRPSQLVPGDLCFLLGCGQLVRPEYLRLHDHNLVAHASDLPQGRGMSPLTWQILEGKNRIPVTLLEAVPELDAGNVYIQEWLEFEGHELLDELRDRVGEATETLCRQFVEKYPEVLEQACPQKGEPSWYPTRGPGDSELDPALPIAGQFELMRVVDNQRYPAFFRLRGHRYRIAISKATDNE